MALPPLRRTAVAGFVGFALAFMTGVFALPDPTGALPIVWTPGFGSLLTIGILVGGVDRAGRFAAVFCLFTAASWVLLGGATAALSQALSYDIVPGGRTPVYGVGLVLVVAAASYVQVYRREVAKE